MNQPAIEVSGLRKSYGHRTVVSVESLQVREGDVLAILGPNGAGKSTMFRLMALLERPDEGVIRYSGTPVTPGDLGARRRTASVFQRPILFQGSVVDNVGYGLRLRRVPRKEVRTKVEKTLEFMGISDLAGADVRTLSGGELQRVALARALVLEPEILFLDEPTSNLDIHVRRRFREDLRRVVDSLTATVVLITHDHNEALGLARRVAVVNEGRIVQAGTPDEVFRRPADDFVADFMGVETVWRGRVESRNQGLCTMRTRAGLLVEVPSKAAPGSDISVAMRPEDVALALPPSTAGDPRPPSSVRNRWCGVVDSLTPAVPLVRVTVRLEEADGRHAGVPEAVLGGEGMVVALITRASMEELGLVPGLRVVASVKAAALHVLS